MRPKPVISYKCERLEHIGYSERRLPAVTPVVIIVSRVNLWTAVILT